jgi:hypothetical protein
MNDLTTVSKDFVHGWYRYGKKLILVYVLEYTLFLNRSWIIFKQIAARNKL